MTCVHGAVHVVGLKLEHSDAIVQLCCDTQGLVTSGIVSDSEGGIMCAYFGDVGVFSSTKLGIVIARLRV